MARRILTRDEQEAENLISQWAEWLRFEHRAIAGSFGSMFKQANGSFEEQLPPGIDVDDCNRVDVVFKKFIGSESPRRERYNAIIAMAWRTPGNKQDACMDLYGDLSVGSRARFTRVSVSTYNQVLVDFRAAVVDEFGGGSIKKYKQKR